ncbi:hypothetical protein ACIQ62_11810 [Streptomyces sp. NPDC096319]|uniref:hypothetical protein n=1 Tax=Streptomyces sp. NPDC096319 TaxID=3366084 RepID=UPI0038054B6B
MCTWFFQYTKGLVTASRGDTETAGRGMSHREVGTGAALTAQEREIAELAPPV